MKRFEFLEHTADVKFKAYGASRAEMLENAALATMNSMIDTATVKDTESWDVDLEADDLEMLAYNWLSELLYLFDVEVAIFCRFDLVLCQEHGKWRLHAAVGGERIDRERHAFDCEVKAVTLHEFEVKGNDVWTIQVVLDV